MITEFTSHYAFEISYPQSERYWDREEFYRLNPSTYDAENDILYSSFWPGEGWRASGNRGNDKITLSESSWSVSGGAGDDTLDGGRGGADLYGGEGNDVLYGDSFLYGGRGDDNVASGREGRAYGGEGNDTVTGYEAIVLFGGAGDDTLGGSADSYFGGDGDDLLLGGNVSRYFQDRDDWMGDYDQALYGGDGNDTIMGGNGDETLYGGAGSNVLFGGGGNDDFFIHSIDSETADGNPEEGFNQFYGGSGYDVFEVEGNSGFIGDIAIHGAGGEAWLDFRHWTHGVEINLIEYSGIGVFDIAATPHDDKLSLGFWTAGRFHLGPTEGVVYGGAGHDHLTLDYSRIDTRDGERDAFLNGRNAISIDLNFNPTGIDGFFELIKQDGEVTKSISVGDLLFDIFIEDFEVFSITASKGDDFIATAEISTSDSGFGQAPVTTNDGRPYYYNSGDDWLSGLAGDDTLISYRGSDTLLGGVGDDRLDGGHGDDILDGGAGEDTAVFEGNHADYTITAHGAGDYTVLSTRDGDAGTDTLTSIEYLEFADGTLTADGFIPNYTETTTLDTDGNRFWESYTDRFDLDGNRISRAMVYDDGREAVTTYENGARTASRVEDAGDAFGWSSLEQIFDDQGRIERNTKINDDGRTYVTTYEDGVRATHVATDPDDVAVWESRTVTYDQNGDTATDTTVYDDGREGVRTYEDGVLSTYRLEDTADAFAWASVARSYDANGQILEISKIHDTGQSDVTTYENGVRSSLVITDHGDVESWASRTLTYDETGTRETLTIVHDDQSVETISYIDEMLTA